MIDAERDLVSLLTVTPVDATTYTSTVTDSGLARLFGGQILAQALHAAGQNVPDTRPPHSLHAYFLRPGRTDRPVHYRVDTLRDGRSFTTCSVTALQDDTPILTMTASFHTTEPGLEHQVTVPAATGPETLLSVSDTPEIEPAIYNEWPWIDVRRVPRDAADDPAAAQVWFKVKDPFPADQLLRTCLLTAITDLSFLSVVLFTHSFDARHEDHLVASIDHALWFHRPLCTDNWLLYDQHSPAAEDGLGLVTGRLFGRDGQLFATAAQQGLIRALR